MSDEQPEPPVEVLQAVPAQPEEQEAAPTSQETITDRIGFRTIRTFCAYVWEGFARG